MLDASKDALAKHARHVEYERQTLADSMPTISDLEDVLKRYQDSGKLVLSMCKLLKLSALKKFLPNKVEFQHQEKAIKAAILAAKLNEDSKHVSLAKAPQLNGLEAIGASNVLEAARAARAAASADRGEAKAKCKGEKRKASQ